MLCQIETLLGNFYKQLREEYNKETEEYHRRLYISFVPRDTQIALTKNNINFFYTRACCPNKWVFSIGLYVNVFEKVSIYFVSIPDLRPHIYQLVHDENFKLLVKVAFYISDTIHPKV